MNVIELSRPVPTADPVPRNGHDQPMVVPASGGRPVSLARTTTFIDCIEDKSSLADWKQNSTLVGALRVPGLVDEVRALDPYGDRKADRSDPKFRKAISDLAERALTASGAHVKRDKGTELHGWSELVDDGTPLPDTLSLDDMIDLAEYRRIVVAAELRFSHAETFTVCPDTGTAGTPDRICYYAGPGPDGEPIDGEFIFDLKTGTIEYGGLKMAAQLAIYSRSSFYDPTVFPAPPYAPSGPTKRDNPEGFAAHKAWKAWCETEFDPAEAAAAYTPLPAVNQDWGIILNLPSGTGEGGLHWVDLRVGWEAAQLAGVIRQMRRLSKDALTAFVTP